MAGTNTVHEACHAVANLWEHASLQEVSIRLGGFLNAPYKKTQDGVTPLMVACDKNQPVCITYMLNHPSPVWGKVDDQSSFGCGGNAAFHHAAMSGCVEAIDLLTKTSEDGSNSRHCASGLSSLKQLITMTNSHGDTPIMMACAYNQVPFLKRLQERLGDEVLLELLNTTNMSGEASISHAFRHGHADVITFVLAAGVEASYEIVEACKHELQEMDVIVLRSGNHSKEFEEQRRNVKRCLVMLEVAHAQKTQKVMDALIQQEIEEVERKKLVQSNSKKSCDLNPKRTPSMVNGNKPSKQNPSEAWMKRDKTSVPDEPITQPRFRTLPDGTVVSSTSKIPQTIEGPALDLVILPLEPSTRSVDEMLRERLHEPTVQRDGIDAVMDSLCLDASMLLLTSHGMAMNLSPSQLEAIDTILQKQLKAVEEAKSIQDRIRSNISR